MPRIQLSASFGKATATLTCEAADNGGGSRSKSFGFGEGVCTCARCMRRAGPIREDVEERITQISYVLANVYADTVNPEEQVKDHHKKKAQDFMTAVEEGQVEKLAALFDSLDSGESNHEEIATELIISAAQLGQADIIKLLTEKGADVEEKDLRRGGRPLMHAANNGHTVAVKTLIDCGADTEAKDDNGYTALMVAIFSDRSSAAEALLQANAQVDAADEKGRTALCYAAMYGSTDCIYLLANHGANVFHQDKDEYTALQLAEDSGRSSAVEALKKLQMKMKMQERRRHRQKSENKGCSSTAPLNTDLAQRKAEADKAAQQLLMEIELEAARKAAKSVKKSKRKGKGKAGDCLRAEEGCSGASTPCDPNTPQHGDSVSDMCRSALAWKREQPRGPVEVGPHGWATTPAPTSPGSLPGYCCEAQLSSAASEQDSQACQPSSQAPPGAGGGSGVKHWLEELLAGGPGAQPGGPTTSGNPPGPCSLPPPTPEPEPEPVDVDALRKDWEALLETAAKCMDAQQQPAILTQVQDMMGRCCSVGISVKYGRKVLQRLEAVGPAREALAAALAAEPGSLRSSDMEAVLRECRPCRSLLDANMLRDLEDKVDKTKKEEEQSKWNSLASALSWDTAQTKPGSHASPTKTPPPSRSLSAPHQHDSPEDHMEPDMECVVCLSAMKNACCIPCGHVCMCQDCAQDVQEQRGFCPVCRTAIDCVIEILA